MVAPTTVSAIDHHSRIMFAYWKDDKHSPQALLQALKSADQGSHMIVVRRQKEHIWTPMILGQMRAAARSNVNVVQLIVNLDNLRLNETKPFCELIRRSPVLRRVKLQVADDDWMIDRPALALRRHVADALLSATAEAQNLKSLSLTVQDMETNVLGGLELLTNFLGGTRPCLAHVDVIQYTRNINPRQQYELFAYGSRSMAVGCQMFTREMAEGIGMGNHGLSRVSLWFDECEDGALLQLADSLTNRFNQVEFLELVPKDSTNGFDVDELRAFFAKLPLVTRIKELRLNYIIIDTWTAEVFLCALERNETIEMVRDLTFVLENEQERAEDWLKVVLNLTASGRCLWNHYPELPRSLWESILEWLPNRTDEVDY